MAVCVQCGFYILMPQSFGDQQRGKDDFTPDVLSDYWEEKGVSVRFNDIT